MKISKIYENYKDHQFILGGIFTNPVFTNDNKILYTCVSRKQKTNKDMKLDESYKRFEKTLLKINKDYNISQVADYPYKNTTNYRIGSNYAGVIIEIENDLYDTLNEETIIRDIKEKYINIDDQTEFIRGIFDTSSSIDVTAQFITRDIYKKNGENFGYMLADILSTYFSYVPMNINVRSHQPNYKTQTKNTQYRIKFPQFFTMIGTIRDYTIITLEKNYDKSLINTDWVIKNGIHYLPMSNKIIVKKDNITMKLTDALTDIQGAKWRKEGIISREEIAKRFERQKPKPKKENSARTPLKKSKQKELLVKYTYCDGITGEKLTKKDSRSPNGLTNTIRDIHHIIPYQFRSIFNVNNDKTDKELRKISDNIGNLIPLRGGTHINLHRSSLYENKLKIAKLFEIVTPYLQDLGVDITIEDFEKIYNK